MLPGFDPSLEALRRRRSYKWRAHPPDVLPAFVAEMDFALAPPVAAALREATALGDTGYAWGDPELAEAFAGFAASRLAWTVDPAHVVAVPDVMAGVLELLRVACRGGDGVVVTPPVYPPFFSHIREAGCSVAEAPLARRGDGWELDLDALANAFAAGARVLLLCNPHNPTGRVFSRGELVSVAELAARHDVIVFSDEIHAPLVLPGATHVPWLTLGEPAVSRGVAFASASKAWNIPGLKCALAVTASPAMRRLTSRLDEEAVFRVGHLGVLASIAAFRDGGDWLDELLVVLDANRRLMGDLLRRHLPDAGYRPPEGGYLGWIDGRGLGLGADPAAALLRRGRVALRPGADFGSGGDGFVRVTMATSPAILEMIVQRMRAALPATSG